MPLWHDDRGDGDDEGDGGDEDDEGGEASKMGEGRRSRRRCHHGGTKEGTNKQGKIGLLSQWTMDG